MYSNAASDLLTADVAGQLHHAAASFAPLWKVKAALTGFKTQALTDWEEVNEGRDETFDRGR